MSDPMLAPDRTAAVALPRAIAMIESAPRAALDAIVAISRELADGPETARLMDVALDRLVVPRYAQVMPWLNAFGVLTEARGPGTFGKPPSWPAADEHANLLQKHLQQWWTDEASLLIPAAPAPEDPARWMLMSWLEAFSFHDTELVPLLRHWADRAAGDGRRDLAWALTQAVSCRIEYGFVRDVEILAPIFMEEVARLESMGWTADAHRTRCKLAQLLGEEPPPRRRLTAPPAPAMRDIEQSLLDEASAELERSLFPGTQDPQDRMIPRDCRSVLESVRHVRALWDAAGTLDPDRLVFDVPHAVIGVLHEDAALASELAAFAVEAAEARTDVGAEVRAMLDALLAHALGGSALVLGERLMEVASRQPASRGAGALALALVARFTALDDLAPFVAPVQRAMALRLAEVARTSGDAKLASEILRRVPERQLSDISALLTFSERGA